MVKIIVSTGRGGTGKTTFIALASKYLGSPQLLVDLDPDQNLAEMLGVDLEEERIKTISDALFDIQIGKDYKELASMPLPERIKYLFYSSCVYESKGFDLISLGVKFTRGCYCAPNNLLRGIIPQLANDYAYTLIDSPAGLEHLNRQVLSEIEDMFVILDPSSKSLRNVQRTRKLAEEIGIRIGNFYIIGNHRYEEGMEKYLRDIDGIFFGNVNYDKEVEKYNLTGRSLLELPDDSPACLSVKRIMEKAGYETSNIKLE